MGRRTRRQGGAIGKLPKPRQYLWSGVKKPWEGKIRLFDNDRTCENCGQKSRCWKLDLRIFTFVELVFDGSTAIGFAVFVLLSGAIRLITTRHKRKGREQFQATVVGSQGPNGHERHDHESLEPLHEHQTTLRQEMFNC